MNRTAPSSFFGEYTMAYKDASEVLALWQSFVKAADNFLAYASGNFEADYAAARDAIDPDGVDSGFENDVQRAALDAFRARVADAYDAAKALVNTVHYSLGRLAGSPDISNRAMNLAYFQDYLVSGSKELKSRGLTKFTSMTPGSNSGNGKFVVAGSNPQGEVLDIAHPQTLTLTCVADSFSGDDRTIEGNEKFSIKGQPPDETFPWNDGGSGVGGEYRYLAYGIGKNEFSRAQAIATSGEIRCVSGAQQTGNAVRGDFENSFSGTATNGAQFIDGWIAVSGGDKISYESSAPVKGAGSLKISGNCKFYYPVSSSNVVRSKTIMFLSLMALRFVSTSLTGTMTLKLLDDSTTHGIITVSLADLVHATKTHVTPVAFAVPANVGSNLRLELEVTSWSDGSAGSSYLLVDEIVCAKTWLVDGGYALAAVGGLAPFRKDDSATGATTDAATGRLQYYSNQVWERSFRHAGTADGWDDPA